MSRCGARIKIIDSISARGDLKGYHLLWAVRPHMLRRLGPRKAAAESYRAALSTRRINLVTCVMDTRDFL